MECFLKLVLKYERYCNFNCKKLHHFRGNILYRSSMFNIIKKFLRISLVCENPLENSSPKIELKEHPSHMQHPKAPTTMCKSIHRLIPAIVDADDDVDDDLVIFFIIITVFNQLLITTSF